MELYIKFDKVMMGRLLLCAAEEVSAEKIVIRAIENFMKGRVNIG